MSVTCSGSSSASTAPKSCSRSWALSSLVFLIAAVAGADTWYTTRAGNFEIFTNIDAARAIHTAEVLERHRVALSAASELNTAVDSPIRVYVFRTKKDYVDYGTRIVGGNPGKDGLSITHPNARVILVDGSGLRVDILLQHELTHHFVRQTWNRLPLWLDEGIAEYYAVTRIVRGNVVQVGRSRDLYRRLVRRYGFIPMHEFLTATSASRWYTKSLLDARFYAQSWLATHWLLTNDIPPERLSKMNPTQLQRMLFRYNQLPALPSRSVKIAALPMNAPEEPRALSADEVQSIFAWAARPSR